MATNLSKQSTFFNLLNVIVLQWLTLRLAYENRHNTKFIPCQGYNRYSHSTKQVPIKERRIGLMIGAIPVTGYRGRFRYLFGRPLYIWGKYVERS